MYIFYNDNNDDYLLIKGFNLVSLYRLNIGNIYTSKYIILRSYDDTYVSTTWPNDSYPLG